MNIPKIKKSATAWKRAFAYVLENLPLRLMRKLKRKFYKESRKLYAEYRELEAIMGDQCWSVSDEDDEDSEVIRTKGLRMYRQSKMVDKAIKRRFGFNY